MIRCPSKVSGLLVRLGGVLDTPCRAALAEGASLAPLDCVKLNPSSCQIEFYIMSKKPLSKKRGRPTVLGKETVYTAIRLPAPMSKAIDTWAANAGISRSGAIRQWIEAGLKRAKA
jgi:hypothetical protein